jgi:hypothetical protein
MLRGRFAVSRASFCRSEPAAALRGLAKGALPAVAPGGGADQPAALVDQVDGQAVDLQFAQVVRLRGAVALGAGGPGRQLVGGEGVVEALHPLRVGDRGEGGGEAAVDLLARRLGGDQRGVGGLQHLQLAHQLVVLTVADQRGVLDVVGEGVPVQLLGQVAVPGARVVRDLGEVLPIDSRLHRRLVRPVDCFLVHLVRAAHVADRIRRL